MPTFSVTYEVYPADMEDEDDAETGFVAKNVSLRQAIEHVTDTNSSHSSQECIEANDSRIDQAEWFTVYNSMDYLNGETESRSLHIPGSVTGASRKRIGRLLGIRR